VRTLTQKGGMRVRSLSSLGFLNRVHLLVL